MKKLTAEKCRDLVTTFKFIDEQGNLSEISGYALQALEIALPIVEQQERERERGGVSGLSGTVVSAQLHSVRLSMSGGERAAR